MLSSERALLFCKSLLSCYELRRQLEEISLENGNLRHDDDGN